MWIIILDNREIGNRFSPISLAEDEDGEAIQFDSFEDAERWFLSDDLSDNYSARYVNMDE